MSMAPGSKVGGGEDREDGCGNSVQGARVSVVEAVAPIGGLRVGGKSVGSLGSRKGSD